MVSVTVVQSNLAELYRRLGRYKEADFLLEHALNVHQEQLRSVHDLNLAYLHYKQALLCYDQGK